MGSRGKHCSDLQPGKLANIAPSKTCKLGSNVLKVQ
jgi:hypothetical protein